MVEVEPHKIWHTPTTMDTLPPKSQEALVKEAATRPNRKNPANLRDVVSQQDKWNEIQKGSQTTMFDKPEKVNGGGTTYPTPVASEARQGFQNRNNGKKGTQKSLTTVVIERNSQLQQQETTKAAIQENILSEETTPNSSRIMLSTGGGQVRFPTPTATDYKGGVSHPIKDATNFNYKGYLRHLVKHMEEEK